MKNEVVMMIIDWYENAMSNFCLFDMILDASGVVHSLSEDQIMFRNIKEIKKFKKEKDMQDYKK